MLMPWLQTTAKAYRKRAKTMRKLSETGDPHSRALFLRLAEYYERMADEVEKDQGGSGGGTQNSV